jgi:hypothetical protein
MKRLGKLFQTSVTLTCSLVLGSLDSAPVSAADVSHGEMAAAIRSAKLPCAHVLKIDSLGDDVWVVQCNSGTFRVSRDNSGGFQVTQTGGPPE